MMSQIRNYMEIIVDDCINDLLKNLHVCDCEVCMLDIKAKALNKLPPQYFLTKKGEMFIKLNMLRTQFEADVASAIAEAAVYVNNNPNMNCKNRK